MPERIRRTGPIDDPVGLIDLMPTLLELGGLEPEPQAQGDSFVMLLLAYGIILWFAWLNG